MKTIYLFIALITTNLIYSQATSSEPLPGEYELLKAKDFVYDGSSGFVFFENMIYAETYGETEWWKTMKGIWKGSYISYDKRSNKYNSKLKEEVSANFSYPNQILKKYELKGSTAKIIDEVLKKERYIIDFVISTTTVNGDHGGNTYTNYYIYDMQEKKQYFILATSSPSKLLKKLNTILSGK